MSLPIYSYLRSNRNLQEKAFNTKLCASLCLTTEICSFESIPSYRFDEFKNSTSKIQNLSRKRKLSPASVAPAPKPVPVQSATSGAARRRLAKQAAAAHGEAWGLQLWWSQGSPTKKINGKEFLTELSTEA